MAGSRRGAARRTQKKIGVHESGMRHAWSGRRVLVVDDFEDNRDIYAVFLEHFGFRVERAVDGLEALEKIAACVPHVVLMDIAMPRLDGWETTRRIKKRWKDVVVIVVTGHALGESLALAKEAGADAVLTKPCTPADVLDELKRQLRSARGRE